MMVLFDTCVQQSDVYCTI